MGASPARKTDGQEYPNKNDEHKGDPHPEVLSRLPSSKTDYHRQKFIQNQFESTTAGRLSQTQKIENCDRLASQTSLLVASQTSRENALARAAARCEGTRTSPNSGEADTNQEEGQKVRKLNCRADTARTRASESTVTRYTDF